MFLASRGEWAARTSAADGAAFPSRGCFSMSLLKYDGSAAALTLASSSDRSGADAADTLTGTAANDGFWGGRATAWSAARATTPTTCRAAHQVVEAGRRRDRQDRRLGERLSGRPSGRREPDRRRRRHLRRGQCAGQHHRGPGGRAAALRRPRPGRADRRRRRRHASSSSRARATTSSRTSRRRGQGAPEGRPHQLRAGQGRDDPGRRRREADLGGGEGLVFRNPSVGQFGAAISSWS